MSYVIVLACLLGAGPPRIPVPTADGLAKARQVVADIYEADLAKARSTESKSAVALKLMRVANATNDDNTMRHALLDESIRLAVDAGNPALAGAALDKIAATFDIDEWGKRLDLAKQTAAKAASQSTHRAIASYALVASKKAMVAERFDEASGLAVLSLQEALKSSDSGLAKRADANKQMASLGSTAYADALGSLDILKVDPTNGPANRKVGQYYCFFKGDWDKGLPLLHRGDSLELRAAAGHDLALPTEPNDQLAVADEWWNLTDEAFTFAFRKRATYWYRRALPDLSGFSQERAIKRLKEFELTVARDQPWVDLIAKVSLQKRLIKGNWERLKGELKVTQDGELRATVPLQIECSGAYALRMRFTPLSGELAGATLVLPVGPDHRIAVLVNPKSMIMTRVYGLLPNDEIEVAQTTETA